MIPENMVLVGRSVKDELLDLKLANRHGLITGATGTGKTVTLQILAEGFASQGVPVFAADIKGDLSGVSQIGVSKDFLEKRAAQIGLTDYKYEASPTIFWDLFGKQGHPIRANIKTMGPLLTSRLLDLNDVQEGVINIVFRVAEDEGLPLVELQDLRALLNDVGQRGDQIATKYGNVAKTSVGAVQRQILVLEQQGGLNFFGEPALDINDFMRTANNGRGYINVLAADKLMQSPKLYATFLLWLMSEMFAKLPEIGDPVKPRLVFFFDEAHLLFDQAPDSLLERIEQVTRLIRSKGVGVYYVTQNPLDVPDTVSSQLGNRVQHALRAFTPREQKAVKAAAETFRPNPEIDTARVIMELGVGEALVSMLEGKGTPSMVQRTLIRPPAGRLGPVTDAERQTVISGSPLAGKYETRKHGTSAAEAIAQRRPGEGQSAIPGSERKGEFHVPPAPGRKEPEKAPRASGRQTTTEAFGKSVARSLGPALLRIGEAVLKSMLRRR